jgi:hypothetical protein
VSKSRFTYWASGAALVVVVAVLLWQLGATSAGREKVVAAPAPASAPPAEVSPASAPPPSPSPSPSPAPQLAQAKPGGADAGPPPPSAHLSEASLMERLRKARAAGRHALAIELAREGNRRFPDSARAPERHSILVHSLADNEQRAEARGEAEHMVNHYPDSEWVREVERFTGAHRHRNVRLNDAGEIEYY